MRADVRRALVLGGTGAVGGAVLAALHEAGVGAEFTWRRSEERARSLSAALDATAHRVDLADVEAIRALVDRLASEGRTPDVLVHAAGVLSPDWDESMAVCARSALAACRALAPHLASRNRGDFVLVGALDRTQSLPLPVAFAAAQGALAAMAMALAKEIGPRGLRVNVLALGPLDAGLGLGLPEKVRADYVRFSALGRFGTPAEAARAILWLALENTYLNGKVVAVNGGI